MKEMLNMKEWITPGIEELKLTETANGEYNTGYEGGVFYNSNNSVNFTPDPEDDQTDKLS